MIAKLPKLLGWGILLVFAWLLKPYGPVNLPSDEAMIANFNGHQADFEQFIQMWQADDEALRISKLYVWTAVPPRQISRDKVRAYRRLLAKISVPTVIGGSTQIEFQVYGWLRPLGTVKSYYYSKTEPIALTNSDTEAYQFALDQYRRVCRPIEENWYICVDHED